MDAFCVHYELWTNAMHTCIYSAFGVLCFPLTACHKINARCYSLPLVWCTTLNTEFFPYKSICHLNVREHDSQSQLTSAHSIRFASFYDLREQMHSHRTRFHYYSCERRHKRNDEKNGKIDTNRQNRTDKVNKQTNVRYEKRTAAQPPVHIHFYYYFYDSIDLSVRCVVAVIN